LRVWPLRDNDLIATLIMRDHCNNVFDFRERAYCLVDMLSRISCRLA
jgi:hypothetical protein